MNCKIAIDRAMQEAEKNIQTNDGDYIGEDGLLYCGKCNTRKQGEFTMPWGVVRPYMLCKCGEEERDRKAAEEAREQLIFKERERLSYLRSNGLLYVAVGEIARMICPEAKKELERICFPESAMRKWTFENDDGKSPKIIEAMKKYVEIFPEMKEQGQGFLLFGDVGTGKTYAAVAAANALLDMGYSVLVTNFAKIANTVGGMFEGKQEYYDNLNCFDLLVIDDLGAERKTEFMQEIVWNVIDSRYRAGLPMIITTNLTAEELKKPQEITNKRIYDRAMERCLPIEVTGANRRHQNTAANYADLKARFGL